MELTYAARTDVGRRRAHNEDAFRVVEGRGLVVVADGMGGFSSGDLAARLACDTIERLVELADDEPRWPFPPDPLRPMAENLLITAARCASRVIYDHTRHHPQTRGMAATVVLGLFDAASERVAIAHAGDATAWRLRAGQLSPLLRTHRLVNEIPIVLTPELQETLADVPPNVVTRALGIAADVQVDCRTWRFDPGDRYLFCTDGVTDVIDASTIENVLSGNEGDLADPLIETVLEAGAPDNATAAIVTCHG
jgi:protein phosphatase